MITIHNIIINNSKECDNHTTYRMLMSVLISNSRRLFLSACEKQQFHCGHDTRWLINCHFGDINDFNFACEASTPSWGLRGPSAPS